MKRDPELKKQRAEFVKRVVNSSRDSQKAIERLSKRLFISEKTIMRDLQN